MAQHSSLTAIHLYGGMGGDGNITMDDGGAGLDAFVDAAVALPALRSVDLCYMRMPPAPLLALARLLRAGGGGGLTEFTFRAWGAALPVPTEDFLTGEAVPAFCEAIQAASSLRKLVFVFHAASGSTKQFHDAAAGAQIMAAARGHPTLRAININNTTLTT
jgi:hypothetical protein